MSLDEIVQRFQAHGFRCVWRRDHWRCQCPAHGGEGLKDLNLSLRVGDKGVILVKCHSHGCTVYDVAPAVGLTVGDFSPHEWRANGQQPPEPEQAWPYRDEQDRVLFQVVRLPGKQFRQRRPEGSGGWKWGLGEARRVLFGLPELLQTEPGDLVAIVEGEKDAVNVASLGLAATTNPMGAGKWRQEYTDWLKEHLTGRRFILLPDNDEPGRKHAIEVYESLKHAGLDVAVAELPELPEKGDVSDWIRQGGTGEALREIVKPQPHPLIQKLLSREQLRNQPAPVWQIDGVFQEASIVEIYGESNHGKSLVGVDIALSVVRSGSWCGREIKKPGAVVYVNADGGPGFSERLHWWERANGEEAIFDFWTYPLELLLHRPEEIGWFIAGLRELTDPPVMIFFDTLSQCIPGVNENQQEQMSLVVAHLNAIKRQYAATMFLLHHVGKDGMNRGSTVIPGAADTIIRCAQVTDELIELRCEKQRNGRKFEPFYFELHYHGLDEGVYLVQGEAPGAGSVRAAREREVLDILKNAGTWLSRDEIRICMPGVSPASVLRYVKALVERGEVIEDQRGEGEGRRPRIYLYRPPSAEGPIF